MKQYHFLLPLLLFSVLFLFACKNKKKTKEPPTSDLKWDTVVLNVTDSQYLAYQNNEFIKQLKDQDGYMIDSAASVNIPESICGQPDFKGIYEYNDEPIDVRNFVTKCSRPVGAIAYSNAQVGFSKFCSGTLISENLFLTASHCTDPSIVGRYVAFNYQLKSNHKLDNQVFFKIIKVVETGYRKGLDYAILQLEGKPGLQFGYTKIDTAYQEFADSLVIIQHPSGRPKEVASGHLSNLNKLSLFYDDIDTERGSSGSGIINSKGELVGVHTNGGCDPFSTNGANHGLSIRAILSVSDTLRHVRQ